MNGLDDRDLIHALRSAGTNGPPARAVMSPAEIIRRARAARRRRSVAAFAGGGMLAATAVTAAVAMVPVVTSGELAITPAGPVTASHPSPDAVETATSAPSLLTVDDQREVNARVILDALPDGFVELTAQDLDDGASMADLAVAREAPATDGLPEGMSAGVSLMTFIAGEIDLDGTWCSPMEEKGGTTTACSDYAVGESVAKTQETSMPAGGRGGAWESIRISYEQPDGDVVVIDIYTWEDRTAAPDRQAAARNWLQGVREQVVPALVDPAIQPPQRAGEDHGRAKQLAADLGPGWIVTTNPEPAVEPGPELGLPDGVQVIVARDVLPSGTDLSALCRGAAGRWACESTEQLAPDVAVSRGRVTQPGDYSTSWEIATVLHERGDGSVVRVQLEGSSVNVDSTPQLRTALAGWLDDVLEDLVAAATTEGFKTEEGPG